jgi:hypothetical protein
MAEVLPVHLADGQLSFSQPALRRSSTSHTSFFVDSSARFASTRKNNYSYSDLQSASQSSSQASSSRSTPASSLSLETGSDDDDDEEDDDDEDTLTLQAYSVRYSRPSSPVKSNSRPPPSPADDAPSSPTTSTTLDPVLISEDDTAVRREPSQHVDYLSHDWNEEDIWSSWRHIVSQRKVYGQRSRLENASWRTWAKSQFKLKTVSPETLNWLKDCDVTWLYGPLQPASNRITSKHASEPASRLSKTNSFLHKKPILKKRSMSEVMLQNSLSASSLVKQAAAAVQAQQQAKGILLEPRRDRGLFGGGRVGMYMDFGPSSLQSQSTSRDPPVDYFSSRSTSGLQTPDHGGERKHIRFDDKVEQCIAVDCKDGDYDDEEEEDNNRAWSMNDDDDSSDDGVVMMKRSRKKRPLSRTNSRASFSGDNKTIAKLPSTTLKYRTDSPGVPDDHPQPPSHHSLGLVRSSGLSPSPSQETLRPSKPSSNFLIPEFENDDDEEDEDGDEEEDEGLTMAVPSKPFQASQDASGRVRSMGGHDSGSGGSDSRSGDKADASAGGLRRTASGMFMPYEEQDQDVAPPGIIGKVVDTVNTARDIAHVIWNVGWRN